MPSKPVRWGYKLIKLADRFGFVLAIDICTKAGAEAYDDTDSAVGPGIRSVCSLLLGSRLSKKHALFKSAPDCYRTESPLVDLEKYAFRLWTDTFYTSLALAHVLRRFGILLSGSLSPRRVRNYTINFGRRITLVHRKNEKFTRLKSL
jgi:hypothetical protein